MTMKPRIIDEDEYRTSHEMPAVTYRATGGMHSMCGPAPAIHALVRVFDLPHEVVEDTDGWAIIGSPWGADDDADGNPPDLVGMARTLGYRVEIQDD